MSNWDDTPTPGDDGFMGGDAYPPLSFKQIGDTHEGRVVAVKRKQDTKPDGTINTWPGGDPKYVYLFEIEQSDGEMGTLWIRGNAIKAIREAVKAAGATSPIGWNLKLQHHALGDPKPGQNPAKLYRAKITPAAVRQPAAAGGFDDEMPF
jgi:hypothetical protein